MRMVPAQTLITLYIVIYALNLGFTLELRFRDGKGSGAALEEASKWRFYLTPPVDFKQFVPGCCMSIRSIYAPQTKVAGGVYVVVDGRS